MVDVLSSRFYVRLHSYYQESEDELVYQVVARLDR